MFNLLVAFSGSAWESGGPMEMEAERFKERSGGEANAISLSDPESLKALEGIQTLLMYEVGGEGPSIETVRFGRMRDVRKEGRQVVFQFDEDGQLPRATVLEFSDRLGMTRWEESRTHWAIKDGFVPAALLSQMSKTKRPRLRFIKKLGEGAFGSVWLAEDTRLNRRVAAKFFKAAGDGSIDWLDQGRALARVDHPNVNRIYSVEDEVQNPETGDVDASALILEYVDGLSLEKLLDQEPPQSPDQILNLGLQIIDGLGAIHAEGLNHLDLHEENILVTTAGRVRLIDIQYLSSLAALSTIPRAKRQRVDFTGLYSMLTRLARFGGGSPESLDEITRLLVDEVFDLGVARSAFERAFAPQSR